MLGDMRYAVQCYCLRIQELFFSMLSPLQQITVIVLMFLKDFKETGYKTETLGQCIY